MTFLKYLRELFILPSIGKYVYTCEKTTARNFQRVSSIAVGRAARARGSRRGEVAGSSGRRPARHYRPARRVGCTTTYRRLLLCLPLEPRSDVIFVPHIVLHPLPDWISVHEDCSDSHSGFYTFCGLTFVTSASNV